MKVATKSASLIIIALLITGCSGQSYTFADVEVDPERYEIIGQGEESATGVMLFQVIPISHNNKIKRAIEKIKKDNNGDDLIKITVKESWFWAYILNGYKVHISGTVIKKRPQNPIEETTAPGPINNMDDQWDEMTVQ